MTGAQRAAALVARLEALAGAYRLRYWLGQRIADPRVEGPADAGLTRMLAGIEAEYSALAADAVAALIVAGKRDALEVPELLREKIAQVRRQTTTLPETLRDYAGPVQSGRHPPVEAHAAFIRRCGAALDLAAEFEIGPATETAEVQA